MNKYVFDGIIIFITLNILYYLYIYFIIGNIFPIGIMDVICNSIVLGSIGFIFIIVMRILDLGIVDGKNQ